jgi:hypothetical protein
VGIQPCFAIDGEETRSNTPYAPKIFRCFYIYLSMYLSLSLFLGVEKEARR